jgi:hypothetical protein
MRGILKWTVKAVAKETFLGKICGLWKVNTSLPKVHPGKHSGIYFCFSLVPGIEMSELSEIHKIAPRSPDSCSEARTIAL